MIEFVFMLTRDDVTVGDAAAVPASLRESGLRSVGSKDVGPPPETLVDLTRAAHDDRHATEDPIAAVLELTA